MTDTQKLGKMGEIAAARYFRSIGYDVLSANYRTHYGEIDVIAQTGDTIVFAEVKTRDPNRSINRPGYNVTPSKQRKIVLAAEQFLKRFHLQNISRFDVIEVYIPNDADHNSAQVNHIINAFTGKNR